MVGVLMGAGIAALVAGLLALAMSIPIRDFSFGSTLMIVGAIGVAAGLVVVALAQILREIHKLGTVPLALPTASARPEFPPRPIPPTATLSPVDAPFPIPSRAAPPAERSPLPPRHDGDAPPAAAPEASRAPVPSKRNLLFRTPRPAGTGREAPQTENSGDAPNVSWPPASPRPPEGLWKRRRRNEAPPAEPMLDLADETTAEAPRVTVLKSGVVDGMAYTLYSDGSIEAQFAEGMVRFASIEALRAHLDQRPSQGQGL